MNTDVLRRSCLVSSPFPLLTLNTIRKFLNALLKDYGYSGLTGSYANILMLEFKDKLDDVKRKIFELDQQVLELDKKYIVVLADSVTTKTWQVFLKLIEDREDIATILVSSDFSRVPKTIQSRVFNYKDNPTKEDVSAFFGKELDVEKYVTIVKYSLYSREFVENLYQTDTLIEEKKFEELFRTLTEEYLCYYVLLLGVLKKLNVGNPVYFNDQGFALLKLALKRISKRNIRLVRALILIVLSRKAS